MMPAHRPSLCLVLLATVSIACDPSDPVPDGGVDAGDLGGSDSGEPDDGGRRDGSADGGPIDELAYLNVLATSDDLARVENPAKPGVKFLARVDGRDPPEPLPEACYFQNMRRWEWHVQFLQQAFPELRDLSFDAYVSWILRKATRRLWGGDVRLWPGVTHPLTQRKGVISLVVYTDQTEAFTLEMVTEVHGRLAACMPFASELLVLVPSHPIQQSSAEALRAELAARGIGVVFPRELIEGLASESYSVGVGFGYLKVVPEDAYLEDYGPRDVVVVKSAPNDISIVAGLLTADPQNLHSHVNLRLQEKGIPNAAVPDVYGNAVIAAMADKLVRYAVTETKVEIRPATLAEAQAFWEEHKPSVPEPRANLEVTAVGRYAGLSAADAEAYGAKAANLAELRNLLPAQHRVEGFGLPFAAYASFIADRGIQPTIDALLADPLVRQDAQVKRSRLNGLRRQIRDAAFPPALLQEIALVMTETFGTATATVPFKFRSSTNVEDLDALTGAGLYDSRRGCLADDLDGDEVGPSRCLSDEERVFLETRLAALRAEQLQHPERTWLAAIIEDIEGDLSDEKSIARAVKRVWSSLWNERAFDEREYYGIDHRKAFMGVAVNPSFALERVNAVALTNLVGEGGGSVYRVVSQVGYESVVQPADPTAVAEVLTFRRDGSNLSDVRRLVSSSLSPGGAPLWSDPDLAILAGLLFTVQDHFEAQVYPELRPLRLDLEVKIERSGEVALKQVRPYVTAGP